MAPPIDITRFERLLPRERLALHRIAIVGCGNLGSHAAIVLTRMGFTEFDLIDPDRVENVNISTQAYALAHIGEYKVEALRETLESINPLVIGTEIPERGESPEAHATLRARGACTSILLLATDTLESRALTYRAFRDASLLAPQCVILDARMGARFLELWAFRYDDDVARDAYEADLLDTRQEPVPCGASSIAYTGSFTAGLIGEVVRRAVCEIGGPPQDPEKPYEPWQFITHASLEDYSIQTYPFLVPPESTRGGE